MSYKDSTPCRHRGAPSEDLVNQTINLIQNVLAKDVEYLNKNGISRDEFERSFSVAIERIRGSNAANNKERRSFACSVIEKLRDSGSVTSFDVPKYGKDSVYRLRLVNGKQVGIIQKGCPDGAHSSTNWTRPDWADELYLWWLCSGLTLQPGEHIWKGVSRVYNKVTSESKNQLDGIIFYNDLCGTPDRPCPKQIEGHDNPPPPCIYVFPTIEEGKTRLNWRGETQREFPSIMLSSFGIPRDLASQYISYVGFNITPRGVKTEITNRYGAAKSCTARG